MPDTAPLTPEQQRAVQYAEKALDQTIEALEHQLRNLRGYRDQFTRAVYLNERAEYVGYFLQHAAQNQNVRLDLLAKAMVKLEVQSDRIGRAGA